MSDVFEKKSVTVTLCGRDYVWEEPVRRVSRAWMRDLVSIKAKVPEEVEDDADADSLVNIEKHMVLMEVIDDVLDFFYKHHAGMAADRAVLDNAGEQEISEAFAALAEFVARPFANAAAAGDADGSTSMPSPGATS
jgi:hypothetical protein